MMKKGYYIFVIILGLCLWYFSNVHAQSSSRVGKLDCPGIPNVFKELANNLVQDGFSRTEICKIFSHSSVHFNPRVMPRKVTHKETSLHYDVFLEKSRLERARKYLEKNKELFDKVEKEYGIPKEVKVAILLVETDLGRYLGSDLALNTLASMAVASDFNKVKGYLPVSYKNLNRQQQTKLIKKLTTKSKWAYSELKSLIVYSELNGLDIHKIRGSIFGAIGLCQFMPSNALKFGVDFDKDGKVDLFDPADAVASMANYLRFYGWKSHIHPKVQIKVIKHYNHSTPYAKTVLKVAEKVKQI